MSSQSVFEHAVKHHLPSAFTPRIEKLNEFQLGSVLLYHHKPHFWRKKELDFASIELERLLVDSAGYKIETEKKILFTEADDQSTRVVHIDLDLDAEIKASWLDLGGKLDGDGKKTLKLSVATGSVSHIESNIYQVLASKSFAVKQDHPLIQEAMDKGSVLFIISSVYESQKLDITISEIENIDIKTNEKASAKKNEGDTGASSGVDTNGFTITKREIPTVFGFHVLRVDITKGGVLVPAIRSGFTHHHKIHLPYGDTFFATDKASIESGATPTEKGGATPNEKGGATSTAKDNNKQ